MPALIILGLILRLINIEKPEGLWNDEYVSWMIANTPFFHGFLAGILKQCHMPLYYLFLKPFSFFSDTVLRLSSVLCGIISIPIMYLLGKEYSKKTAYYAASITSVLSFLIYYSQEVRFYSLVFLLSALLVLYTIKKHKLPNKINNICFYLFSFLLVFTHVLGIIFVFFCWMYLIYKKKLFCSTKKIFRFLIPVILLGISVCIGFLGVNILEKLPSSQWWGTFSYNNILFMFTDFFSPILTNNVNIPPTFFYNLNLLPWMIIPTILAIILIISGVKQNKGLTVISFLTILVMSVLAKSGLIVFITKYSIEVLPIFIILMACGAVKLDKKGSLLIILFISIHLLSVFSPYHVTKIMRAEGNRIVGEIINVRKPQNVIFTYYAPDRFLRYADLSNIKTFDISKSHRFEFVDEPQKILKQIKSGETVSIVFLNSVSFYSEEFLQEKENDVPEMFATYSHIKNRLLKEIYENNYNVLNDDKYGAWQVITIQNP